MKTSEYIPEIICWSFAGLMGAVLMSVMIFGHAPPDAAATASAEKPVLATTAAPTWQKAKEDFAHCVMPAAQLGNYSSYDGGKSAVDILRTKCPMQTGELMEACEAAAGSNGKDCTVVPLIAAQAALKSFGK